MPKISIAIMGDIKRELQSALKKPNGSLDSAIELQKKMKEQVDKVVFDIALLESGVDINHIRKNRFYVQPQETGQAILVYHIKLPGNILEENRYTPHDLNLASFKVPFDLFDIKSHKAFTSPTTALNLLTWLKKS